MGILFLALSLGRETDTNISKKGRERWGFFFFLSFNLLRLTERDGDGEIEWKIEWERDREIDRGRERECVSLTLSLFFSLLPSLSLSLSPWRLFDLGDDGALSESDTLKTRIKKMNNARMALRLTEKKEHPSLSFFLSLCFLASLPLSLSDFPFFLRWIVSFFSFFYPYLFSVFLLFRHSSFFSLSLRLPFFFSVSHIYTTRVRFSSFFHPRGCPPPFCSPSTHLSSSVLCCAFLLQAVFQKRRRLRRKGRDYLVTAIMTHRRRDDHHLVTAMMSERWLGGCDQLIYQRIRGTRNRASRRDERRDDYHLVTAIMSQRRGYDSHLVTAIMSERDDSHLVTAIMSERDDFHLVPAIMSQRRGYDSHLVTAIMSERDDFHLVTAIMSERKRDDSVAVIMNERKRCLG